MFVTLDKIKSAGEPCAEGLLWFERWFPNGAELSDVIQHKYVNTEFLHWGYTHLDSTKEEKTLYWKKLKVDDESRLTCHLSEEVSESYCVRRSTLVEGSRYVGSSKSVFDSEMISNCTNVENSKEIYASEFVEDSSKIINCRNVVRSNNVVASNFVVDSKFVWNSSVVTNSMCVGGLFPDSTKKIDTCAFIDNCENLHHCLFCSGQKNGEYLLFNQSIAPMQFDLIKKQLDRILSDWEPAVVENWPEPSIILESPKVVLNVAERYGNLPESFWRWITTLPNYNPDVLYTIIMQKRIFAD